MKTSSCREFCCVSLVLAATLGYGAMSISAELDSFTWQPEGLKRVFGSENGRHWWHVRSLAFGPKGKWIASGGEKNLYVWNTDTLEPLAFAHGLPQQVLHIDVHPSGQFIAVGLQLQVLIFEFDGQQLTERHRLTGYSNVSGVRYTLAGSVLVVTTDAQTHLYDVTGKLPTETRVLQASGRSVDVSPNGRLALVARGKLSVWDIATAPPREIVAHKDSHAGVAIRRDGQMLATTNPANETATLWRLNDGELEEVVTWTSPHKQIGAMRFSQDGKTLFASSGRKVLTWDLSDEPILKSTLSGTWYQPAFAVQDSRLAVGNRQLVQVIEYASAKENSLLARDSYNGYQWYPGLNLWADPSTSKTPIPLDDDTAKRITKPIEGTQPGSHRIAKQLFSRDGNRHAVLMKRKSPGEEDKLPGTHIRIVSIGPNDSAEVDAPIVLHGDFSSMAWDDAGKLLATGSSGKLQRWDATTGKMLEETAAEGECAAVYFRPNGEIMSVRQKQTELGDFDKTLVTWNPTDGATTKQFPFFDRSRIDQARISGNGRFLALRKRGKPIRIYHFDGKQLGKTCELDVDAQYFMKDFSPSGELLALATWGGKRDLIGLFDARTGNQVQQWPTPGVVHELRFRPDGDELALFNGNQTIYVLEVPAVSQIKFSPSPETATQTAEFQPPQDDATLRTRFEKLLKESKAANAKWRNPPNKRKGQPPFLRFAKQFMEIGRSHPETASGRDALVRVCRADLIAGYDADNKEITKLQVTASRLLLQHHFLDPQVFDGAEVMCYRSKDVRASARRLIRESPDRKIQARACLILARHYDGQLRMGYDVATRDIEDTIRIYQWLLDNYSDLHMWEGGPSYRSIGEDNLQRLNQQLQAKKK